MKIPNRRENVTVEKDGFAMTISFLPEMATLPSGEKIRVPCEVFFSKRARDGSDLDLNQRDLSIEVSKVMQGEGWPFQGD
jgi:hypothetical protein